ncbi:RNA polymerase sigma factor [Filimonas lacunae]|uniref:RNA polymerase sigma factor n=1 Tax=Filimonas lacunae TaxID=477680 RepID=UPI0007D7351B|nr:RNA polymerase sigma factor [Filimonas lacunae]BAV10037.1 RNA polymerase ECF-type sigma factor [Filimonas lacunae]
MPGVPHEYKKIDLQLIAEGDERAFYEFYLQYTATLHTFLRRHSGLEGLEEDIIQETFIRVWLYRDRLPEIENVAGWIYRIASRVYSDHLQREIKRRQRKEGFGTALYDTEQTDSTERTHLQQLTLQLHRAVDSLSEHQKKLYWLNREQQMKPAAIAAHLNMPVGTVKNQLSAALREIREHMMDAGFSSL